MRFRQLRIPQLSSVVSQAHGLLCVAFLGALSLACPSAFAGQKSALYFVHADHLGTPKKVTDDNGTIVWAADYEPFGRAFVQVNAIATNVRFPGQYSGEETPLHYNYLRDYDPAIGRYVESDPVGMNAGTNTYSYVSNNPIQYVDPLGLIEWEGHVQQLGGMYYGAGWVKLLFELTSECVDGQQATIQVEANGPVTGLGMKLTFGAVDGSIAFEDFANEEIIPGLFDGTFNFLSFSTAVGAGATIAKIRLGKALQIRSYVPLPVTGLDVSAAWSGGASDVKSVRYADCDCEPQ